jgi:hypothetical protein
MLGHLLILIIQIFPEAQDNEGDIAIKILNRHLYWRPPKVQAESVAMSVPYSILRRVIASHESRQQRLDKEDKATKQKRSTDEDDEEDQYFHDLKAAIQSKMNQRFIDAVPSDN